MYSWKTERKIHIYTIQTLYTVSLLVSDDETDIFWAVDKTRHLRRSFRRLWEITDGHFQPLSDNLQQFTKAITGSFVKLLLEQMLKSMVSWSPKHVSAFVRQDQFLILSLRFVICVMLIIITDLLHFSWLYCINMTWYKSFSSFLPWIYLSSSMIVRL